MFSVLLMFNVQIETILETGDRSHLCEAKHVQPFVIMHSVPGEQKNAVPEDVIRLSK